MNGVEKENKEQNAVTTHLTQFISEFCSVYFIPEGSPEAELLFSARIREFV